MTGSFQPPPHDCPLCPRLVEFRLANRAQWPDWHNAPVPAFGPLTAPLLVVGLAPGLRGANCTGRPFTGDYAGDLLYPGLLRHPQLAEGQYEERKDDSVCLTNARITNAVRCVPPENKPTTAEQKACLPFLKTELAAMPQLKIILALGLVAHGAVLSALSLKKSAYAFTHGAFHDLPNGLILANSYHCSRYNVNTGRLSEDMFFAVMEEIVNRLAEGVGFEPTDSSHCRRFSRPLP